MEIEKMLMAINNETRFNLLRWLKNPEKSFEEQLQTIPEGIDDAGGICVNCIMEKTRLTQSTTSHHVSILCDAKLLEKNQLGKYHYYKRDEKMIQKCKDYINKEL